MDALAWLMSSDPAIAWQAMRDLSNASPGALAEMRARVAREGLGARILASQGADGAWHREGEPDWLPTLFTSLLLRATGIDPGDPVVAEAATRMRTGFRWHEEFGARPFFEGEVEPCINGHTLAVGTYFGHPVASLAERLLRDQLPEGGWNCDAPKSTRASFHSTICVLEGLLEYERAVGSVSEITRARRRGEAYLLERSLFRRKSTGEPIKDTFTQIAFPPRYHYDILRALDYFRAAEAPRDPRMDEAVSLLEAKRQPDGRWLLERAQLEMFDVPVGEAVGEPSAWNTLRALRVLRWYRGAG